jgi:hypothetical protein
MIGEPDLACTKVVLEKDAGSMPPPPASSGVDLVDPSAGILDHARPFENFGSDAASKGRFEHGKHGFDDARECSAVRTAADQTLSYFASPTSVNTTLYSSYWAFRNFRVSALFMKLLSQKLLSMSRFHSSVCTTRASTFSQ